MIVNIIIFSCITSTINALHDKHTRGEADLEVQDDTCLTGYMTDVQSWVNANGSLARSVVPGKIAVEEEKSLNGDHVLVKGAHGTPSRPILVLPNNFKIVQVQKSSKSQKFTIQLEFVQGSTLDLSYNLDALAILLHSLTWERRRRSPITVVSLARSGLQEIPQIFSWSTYKGITLSSTIEYISFYGNNFNTPIGTGQQYDVVMNATLAMELSADSVQRLTKSWSNGFIGIKFPNLKELDLRACSITTLEDRTFAEMPNLESLYLGENAITHIQARAFAGLKQLIHLDLSRNYAFDENNAQKNLVLESMDLFAELKNLHSLDFSFTKLTQRNSAVMRSLSPKMQRLSLCYTSLDRLRPSAFDKTVIKYLDLSGNSDVLTDPKALHGLEETLTVLYAEDINLKTMEPLKHFRKLEILQLSNNEINVISKAVVNSLNNLQILDLDVNRIITWFESSVSLMPKLQLLSLRHNNINMITDEMASDLATTSFVSLAGNFIICNCNARDLFELGWRNEMKLTAQMITNISASSSDKRLSFHTGFRDYNNLIENRLPLSRPCSHKDPCDMDLELKYKGDLRFLDYYPKEYECLLLAERKSTTFHNFPTCVEETSFVPNESLEVPKVRNRLLLIIIPGLLLPALAILFMFRRNLRYCLITMRNSAALSLINKNETHDENKIFNYDVFVSYCNEDRAWVLDQLLPHVERDCNVSVCLHERDFQVGLSILENIVSCMDRSRSIMLILSQRFLLSQWCQFEMHLAQHRLLETRREDLILILLEEIPRRLRPNTLHYLMVTKTYIVWPQSQEERSQFWRRLKKSLVTQKLKHAENVSLA